MSSKYQHYFSRIFKQNNDKAIQEFNCCLATKAVINDNYKNFWMKHLFWIPIFTLAPVIKIDFIKTHAIMILSVHALQNTIQIFLLIGRDFSSKEDSLENTIKRHFSLSEKMAHLSAVTITFIRVIPLSIIKNSSTIQ